MRTLSQLMTPRTLRMIRRDHQRLLPGRVVIYRRDTSFDEVGGQSGTSGGTPLAVGTVPARVRPLFGQTGEAEFGDRITARDNFIISVPHDAPDIRTHDQLVYLDSDVSGGTAEFEVKSIDDAKGEWDVIRRIIVQRTRGGGGF